MIEYMGWKATCGRCQNIEIASDIEREDEFVDFLRSLGWDLLSEESVCPDCTEPN